MKSTRRKILISCCIVLAVPLAIASFLTIYTEWEMHRVARICAVLTPGTPLAAVAPTIKKFWMWNGPVSYQFEHPENGKPGWFTEKDKSWDIAVPALSTMGDMQCFITHNGVSVTGTQVLGP